MLHFNTALNKSAEWGTLPWHWYVSSALPRALLGAGLLIPLGVQDMAMVKLLAPVLCFVALYSALPHKEFRFIIYAVPILDIAAARGLARLLSCRRAGLIGVVLLTASAGASMVFLGASHLNYPGGLAFSALHRNISCAEPPCRVHIGVMPAMTGVSRCHALLLKVSRVDCRFGEEGPPETWIYSKEEGEIDMGQFTHLLTGNASVRGFRVLAVQNGFDGLRVKAALRGECPFALNPMVYLMEREGLNQPSSTSTPSVLDDL